MNNKEQQKKIAAKAALKFIKPGTIVGVGTGSTVNYFIEALGSIKDQVKVAVASSESSAKRLKEHGISVVDANQVTNIDVYIDGADEINPNLQMIKGGGGALTREKIVAALAKTFICIVDQSKVVQALGDFPLPIEVIPMARSYVSREMVKMGGMPRYREGFVTDNGNEIIDIYDLLINEPIALEEKINHIAGVVAVGLFARRHADILLIGQSDGTVNEVVSQSLRRAH